MNAKLGKQSMELDQILLLINYFEKASKKLILEDQRKQFPDVIQYFDNTIAYKSSIPTTFPQLNIFIDKQGILLVKSKFKK